MTRLPFVESAGIYYFQGRQYKTLAAVERAEQQFIERAEKIAGRPLALKELLQGVHRKEDRDRAQQISDQAFHVHVVADKPADTRHPFDRADAMLAAGGEQTREGLNQKMRDAYDQRIAAENKAPEPRRAEAIAHAHELWASVAFDKSISMSLFVRAQQLIIVAQRASVDEYKIASGEFLTKLAEHKASTLAAIELQRHKSLADLPSDFEPVEPLPAEAPAVAPHSEADIVALARKGEGAKAAAMLRENEQFKREASK